MINTFKDSERVEGGFPSSAQGPETSPLAFSSPTWVCQFVGAITDPPARIQEGDVSGGGGGRVTCDTGTKHWAFSCKECTPDL